MVATVLVLAYFFHACDSVGTLQCLSVVDPSTLAEDCYIQLVYEFEGRCVFTL